MKKVVVGASSKYEILIENGILEKVGYLARELVGKRKCLLVSDTNVFPLYGEKVVASLENADFEVIYYVIEAGEESKNQDELFDLISVLADNGFCRKDVMFALGGGVVGDLVGFCASIFLRGIRFFQIPTTLLAASDSSVGGKTAIDIPQGKNLVGTFWQPTAVFFDPLTLDTLPPNVYSDGAAEVIKYGVILDNELFESIASRNGRLEVDDVVRCIEIKRDVVERDEFEGGIRKLLNFGHTFGHAIEKVSHFSISHGQAVAMGMRMIARAFEKRGEFSAFELERLFEVLNKYSLSKECPFSSDELAEALMHDKKREGNEFDLIVPKRLGHCVVERHSLEETLLILKDGASS